MIGLEAPGNYSASNRMSVLLCEGPKPPTPMIPGFLDPKDPVFIDLNLPNYFRKYKEI